MRLVKGAYQEPKRSRIRKARCRRGVRAADEDPARERHYPAIATHDPAMIAPRKAFAERERASASDRFEFQMLYGIRRDLQQSLVAERLRASASTFRSAASGFPTSCAASANGRPTCDRSSRASWTSGPPVDLCHKILFMRRVAWQAVLVGLIGVAAVVLPVALRRRGETPSTSNEQRASLRRAVPHRGQFLLRRHEQHVGLSASPGLTATSCSTAAIRPPTHRRTSRRSASTSTT